MNQADEHQQLQERVDEAKSVLSQIPAGEAASKIRHLLEVLDKPERRGRKSRTPASSKAASGGLVDRPLDRSKKRRQDARRVNEDIGRLRQENEDLQGKLSNAEAEVSRLGEVLADTQAEVTRLKSIFSETRSLLEDLLDSGLAMAQSLRKRIENWLQSLPSPNLEADIISPEELAEIPLYPGRPADSLEWYEEHWATLVRRGRVWQHHLREHDPKLFNALKGRLRTTGKSIWELVPPQPGYASRARRHQRRTAG